MLKLKYIVVWATLKPPVNQNMTVGVVYMPERGKLYNLRRICDSINMNKHDEVVIVGDFNFPNLDWENPDSLSASEELYLETLQHKTYTRSSSTVDSLLNNGTTLVEIVSNSLTTS